MVDKARDMHEDEGKGYGAIAQELGVSKTLVRKWCSYELRAQTYEKWKRVAPAKMTEQGAPTSEPVTED